MYTELALIIGTHLMWGLAALNDVGWPRGSDKSPCSINQSAFPWNAIILNGHTSADPNPECLPCPPPKWPGCQLNLLWKSFWCLTPCPLICSEVITLCHLFIYLLSGVTISVSLWMFRFHLCACKHTICQQSFKSWQAQIHKMHCGGHAKFMTKMQMSLVCI